MSASIITALLGITVAATVPLIAAYLHRKQMRQIEYFRVNPSAGLVPPPHRLTRFLKKNKSILFLALSSSATLVGALAHHGPITRWQAVEISWGIVGLFVTGLLYLFDLIITLLGRMAEAIVELRDAGHAEKAKSSVEQI